MVVRHTHSPCPLVVRHTHSPCPLVVRHIHLPCPPVVRHTLTLSPGNKTHTHSPCPLVVRHTHSPYPRPLPGSQGFRCARSCPEIKQAVNMLSVRPNTTSSRTQCVGGTYFESISPIPASRSTRTLTRNHQTQHNEVQVSHGIRTYLETEQSEELLTFAPVYPISPCDQRRQQ